MGPRSTCLLSKSQAMSELSWVKEMLKKHLVRKSQDQEFLSDLPIGAAFKIYLWEIKITKQLSFEHQIIVLCWFNNLKFQIFSSFKQFSSFLDE